MEELEQMEKMDFERVVEAKAWVNGMVTIWKPENKKVRMCMEYARKIIMLQLKESITQ